jgi:hypothetical protein
MANRFAIFVVCLLVVLVGSTATAQADTATQLPFANGNGAWLAVDPSGQHVFVSGGSGTSSIVVLNYAGTIVKTITGQGGASQMAVDTATHTLYVALHDQTAISEINTQTLAETKRFSTSPYPDPSSLVIAGGKLWFSCFQNDGEGCHGIVSADLDGSNMAQAPAPIASYFFATALTAGGSGNKYLAVGDSYQEPPDVDVYDVSGATPTVVSHVHDPDGGSAQVRDMTFDPSGANLLLACGAPYYVESLATSNLLSSGQYPTGPYPISVAVTANGQFVAGGINTNSGPDVFVYPVGNTTPVRTWQVGDDNLSGIDHGLAFSPDASLLFAVVHDSATGHLAFHVLSQPTVALVATTTSLTRVTPSSGTVRYGSQASLKVQVTGAASGKVDLYATPSGGTKKLVASGTLASGAASFSVTPTQNTTYSAELEQGSGFASSTSPDVSISVAPIASVAARAAGKTRLHGHRVSRVLLTGKVKPARPSEPLGFLVQRRVRKSWRTTASGTFPIGSNGVAPAFFFTNRAAQFRARVQFPGDSDYAGATSPWKKFRTRKIR